MSITSDFWKAMNQSGTKVSGGSSQKSSSSSGSVKNTSGGSDVGSTKKKKKKSITEEFWEAMADDDIAPVSSVSSRVQSRANGGLPLGSDLAPVARLTDSKKDKDEEEEKWYHGWFDKGALKDGYDPGDISKAILGTLADVGEDLATGIVGMGEKTVDFFAGIAPYALLNQGETMYMPQSLREKQNEIYQQAVKESDEFIAKDLYDENAVAKQLLSNMYGNAQNTQKLQNGQMLTEADLAMGQENAKNVRKYMDEQMELDSVLGEKSDSLVQSAGVLAAQAGLQAVGIPWYLTSGVTSMGAETENALKQGATHEEALMSGAISAVGEIVSEKMFGGDIFTKNGAGLATKYLSRTVSNKIVRNLAKAGIDVAGEGFEEAASQVVSRLGSSLYKDDNLWNILTSEEALDEYLESAIGGMVLGGGMTAINIAQSNAAGVDYTTGLTENEQKVVDKLYKEYQTEDMDSHEKKQLYDDVLRAMDRGTIDAETIAEILDSDSHKAYDSLTKESEEFKTLYGTPFEKLSAEQNDRLKELQAKHEAKKYEKALEEARSKRFTDTWDMVRGTRLEESFREKLRMDEDFVADFDRFKGSKHEEAARKTLQSAIDLGVNNTNAMHDVVDLAANIASQTGRAFTFKDGDTIKQDFINRQTAEIAKLEQMQNRSEEDTKLLAEMKDILAKVESGKVKVNGDITADGITLNLDSENPLEFTVGHEVTHSLEKAKVYDKLRDALYSYAKAKNVDIDKELTNRKAKYAGIEKAEPEKELVADLVGSYVFTDYDFIHNLSTEHRNVFQKVYDEIKHLCKLATAGSKAARDLERVKRQFEKAYREAHESSSETTDTKYSLVTDQKTIDFLENQEHMTVYKAMSMHDGKLYPPMASQEFVTEEYTTKKGEKKTRRVRKLKNPSVLGQWQQSDERPDLIKSFQPPSAKYPDGYGKFDLLKSNGKTTGDVAYNPYEHTSNIVMNDQFSEAYQRPELVTVEYRIPVSELTSGYKAKHAKDAVGLTDWKAGGVAQKLKNSHRDVYLTRWSKPVRVLSDAEVAQKYKEILDKEDGISIPWNVVTPSLRMELEKVGVPVDRSVVYKGKTFEQAEAERQKAAKYSLSDSDGKQLTKAQQDYFKDSKVRDENGNLKVMYHGTSKGGFTVFDTYKSKYGLFGTGFYFTDSENIGESYTKKGKGNNPQVYEAYLNIKNPLDMDAPADPVEWAKAFDDVDFPESGTNEDFYRAMEEYYEDQQIAKWEVEDIIRESIEYGMGYDGITHIGGGRVNADGERHRVYIAFEPEQIKNVDNAKPTENPDIRYSLSDSETDETYFDAVVNKDWETAERMVEEAAKKAGYTKVVYHGTDARFTRFDTDEESTAREQHAWMADYPDGTIFLAEDYDVADGYGERVMNLLLDTSDMKVFEEPDMYAHRAMDDKYGYEVYNYPVIAVKGKDMTIYATLDNTLVKSADTVTYGDGGEIIPLSERFKHGNEDIRYSLSEETDRVFYTPRGVEVVQNPTNAEYRQMREEIYKDYPWLRGTGEAILRHTYDESGNEYYWNAFDGMHRDVEPYINKQYNTRTSQQWEWWTRKNKDDYPEDYSHVRYSLSNAETDKNYLDAVNSGDTETARKIMEQVAKRRGYTIHAYHGTARGDRVGNVFLPERATSGPMAFFTDSKEIAENYSKSKQDTSMAYDPDYDRYETQFRIKTKYQDIPLYRAWGYLPFDARNRITKKAGQLRENWDGDYELMLDPDTNEGNGGFQWQLKEARGNAIQALTEQWLNSGTLFNEESRFLDVLEMAGVTEEFKKIGMDSLYFKDPNAKHEKVYDTFLRIRKPFDTATVDEQFISDLESWYEEQDQSKYVRENMESDLWDKNGIDAYDFADRLRSDLENNTTHAWTSIPDSVTDYLKHLGHDGIKDTGGKFSGDLHTVWIPFSSSQIKSAETVTYDDAGNVIPITERFDKKDVDIRHSLSDSGKPFKRSINSVYGKDARVQNPFDIAPIVDESVRQPSKPWTIEEMFPDEETAQSELDNLTQQQQSIYGRMMDAMNAEDMEAFTQETIEYENVTKRIEELENEISESEIGRADSLMGEEVPPEMDAPYYETEPTVLTKKATADIVRDVRKSLDLTNPQMADAKDIIERWRSGAIQTREQLVDALRDKFGKYTEVEEDERLREIKREIRTRKINVSRAVQRNFPDYADMMRRNRGKIFFSKEGLAVDEVYQELNSLYPEYFPIEMNSKSGKQNAADQLEKLIEIANTPHVKETQRNKAIETIEEAADIIIKGIDNFRLNQDLALSERESRVAFADLMRNADQYVPPEDIAPVPSAAASQPKETKVTKGTPKKVAPQKTTGRVAEVLTKASKPEKQSGFGMKVVSQTVDKGMAVENLSLKTGNHELQSKYNYALPTNTEARAQYFMENGADGVKPFKETVQEITKSGKQNDFERYMYHAHNVDRMSLEQRFGVPNKAVYGDSITADVSRAEIKRYESQNPEFKAWAEEIYAITKWQRSLLVESGVISQETADLWEKMYPHYVPITRKDAKGANVYVPLDTNKTGVNAPIKRAAGGNSDIEPMLNTIAQRIEQTYRAIARNSFGIELKNTLGTTIGTQKGADVDEMIDTIEAQEEKLLKPGTINSNPTFTVFENGERVEFEITEDLFDSLKPAGMLGHRIEALSKMGNFRRNLLTVWNPVFALYRNPIKDIQDVAVNSQHPLQTYISVPKAIKELAMNGKWAKEYHENGGKSNTYFDNRTNTFKEDSIFKKTIGMPVRAVEAAGEFIEEIPRLSEYIASRLNGRTIERSMLDASRVTTNFAAGGDFTKFLNSHGFTFLNASVQGASQHVRNFREAKQQGLKGYVKVLAKYTVAGLPGILLNGLLWDDDEEYEELSDYVKQNYYVVAKTEDGKFVRIPKGRTAAVMQNAFEQMEHLVTGDDEADFQTFFELFMNNIAPNNPIENNILAPIGQVLKNEAWYGGDLVPARLQDLPAEEQFDESTDSLSKWLGEQTGTSPYKWNYLIDQYSGGLGDVFLPMMTPEAESGDDTFMGNVLAPWKKELLTDKELNNKNPGDFYDLKDELEVMSNSSKATEEDTMRSMYMDSVSWEMSDLYKQKREIQNSSISDSRKYEKVREIQEQINALAENALNNYNHVSIDGLYSEAGDKRYNKDEESGKWYEIKPKNADGTDNWYYQKEQEVTKALGISYGEYWNNREEYNYAYDKPEQYAVSKACGGYESYKGYTSELWDIKADKDENGKSINGSRKKKVINWLNDLDADYYTKIILFKNEYNADDTYNYEIIEHLNSRDDISYSEMEMILKYLGFNVDSEGNITWD